VMHARNIATGRPYTQTGYVFQPESTTEVGANAYPSGLPLILAPVYGVEGLNLRLFKLLNALFLVLSLWPAYLFARQTLSRVASLILIVALGFSWFFLTNFDSIGSDAPYQLVSLWVLLFLLRIYQQRRDETNPWMSGVWAGLSIAAAYLIRPVGIAFLLSLAGVEILRKRRPSPFLIAAAASFVPLLFLNNFLFHTDGGYTHQFTLSPSTIAHHVFDYARYFSYVFANPVSNKYRYILWIVTLIPVLFGLLKRVRGAWGITELYVLTLLAVDCVYWGTTARYLLPIMPIYLVYMIEGFEAIVARVPPRLVLPLKAAAATLFLLAPAANAFLMHPDSKDTLVTATPYEELCAAIRRQTDPHALVIFWNPRVLALSTSRQASGWPAEGDSAEMIHYLQRVHPNFIVADKKRLDDQRFLLPVLAASPLQLNTVYENDRFRLVQLK